MPIHDFCLVSQRLRSTLITWGKRGLMGATILLLGVFVCGQPLALASELNSAGTRLFEVHCAGCHANGGNIVRRGKTLKLPALKRNGVETPEAIAQLIANGKGNMSAYRDRLTSDEISELARYVLDRASSNWQ
jgi:cytochrome c6